ncbi:MAG TPA: nucleotidyltransferase family protein, partial [candidate division WOR-3 bacterium]|nr:nucleotidyltransferase family protein [candidate division WOR-3 bacterium]
MNIETIVLAAGLSERVGVFKMELPLGDKTLIERTIEGPYQVSSRIIVVGGYKIERLREILSSYEKVEVVFNKNYKRGMFSSVKEGVKYVQ